MILLERIGIVLGVYDDPPVGALKVPVNGGPVFQLSRKILLAAEMH
jgi:hypothetical protein